MYDELMSWLVSSLRTDTVAKVANRVTKEGGYANMTIPRIVVGDPISHRMQEAGLGMMTDSSDEGEIHYVTIGIKIIANNGKQRADIGNSVMTSMLTTRRADSRGSQVFNIELVNEENFEEAVGTGGGTKRDVFVKEIDFEFMYYREV